MFDIEKAKERGLDPESIEIMQQINNNIMKRNSCKIHEFKRGSRSMYRCKNCGCEEDSSFVAGYMQGLKHGNEEMSGGEVQ